MPTLSHATFSTVNSLKRTIETDKKVFSWFFRLLFLPAVIKNLKGIEGNDLHFKKLKTLSYFSNVLAVVLLCFIAAILMTRHIILIGFIVLLLFIYLRLSWKIRQYVAKISLSLVFLDFNDEKLRRHTLYQIGDFYANKYQYVSLVQIISSLNTYFRRTLLYTFVFVTFVFPIFNWF